MYDDMNEHLCRPVCDAFGIVDSAVGSQEAGERRGILQMGDVFGLTCVPHGPL